MRNIKEEAVHIIQRIDSGIEHSSVKRVLEPVAPGDAGLGEIAARATVDGIPIGISLAIIRGVVNGNLDPLMVGAFLLPMSLAMSVGIHSYLGGLRKNSKIGKHGEKD